MMSGKTPPWWREKNWTWDMAEHSHMRVTSVDESAVDMVAETAERCASDSAHLKRW